MVVKVNIGIIGFGRIGWSGVRIPEGPLLHISDGSPRF